MWVLVERCLAGRGFNPILKEDTGHSCGSVAFHEDTRGNFLTLSWSVIASKGENSLDKRHTSKEQILSRGLWSLKSAFHPWECHLSKGVRPEFLSSKVSVSKFHVNSLSLPCFRATLISHIDNVAFHNQRGSLTVIVEGG